jgi:hypothetical protein
MHATITPGRGWRLSLAAGALVALTVGGCSADIQPPANEIGDTIQDAPAVPVPSIPDGADPRRCTEWPAEARAEKMSLCRE